MRILGISAFYHDSAAALVVDGRIAAAAQEERFTRKKHDSTYPGNAVDYCLQEGMVSFADIDFVAFYDKPFLKFERLMETYLSFAPRGFKSFSMAVPIWLKEKLFQKEILKRRLKKRYPDYDWDKRLLFTEHHQAHAASAFYPSPFDDAAILTMDGVGEWATTSVGIGSGNNLQMIKEIHFPHSIGLLYSAFTYHTGFKVNSGEYKVMGLAPYGRPIYKSRILDNLIDLKEDGSFRLNLDYFDYCIGLRMTNELFDSLFDGPPRDPTSLLEQRHMDLAASIQAVTEEIVLRLTRSIARETKETNLCLAGGVALNCVANSKILHENSFSQVWVQPAAGDAGGALGAALAGYHLYHGQPRQTKRKRDNMEGSYLGPAFSNEDITTRLSGIGANFEVLDDKGLLESVAKALEDGKAVGWFQGRMEFGPRALGARSILGDARSPTMQKNLNMKVKYRESFRPFAPAILRENLDEWFNLDCDSPYMLFVASVKSVHQHTVTKEEQALFGIEKLNVSRSDIPAVTHVDYSARIQTVDDQTNSRFHSLLSTFKARTGCPILINTSFNVRGEPIVCTPEDAFRCFMGTEIDILAVGNCYLRKEDQNSTLKNQYATLFDLD